MIIIGSILALFFIMVFLMIPVAIFKTAKAKAIACPQCGLEMKMISSTVKCRNCKAKLYKHVDGDYRIRA